MVDTVSATTRQAEVRRAEDVSSEPRQQGYLVGDDVWWKAGVLSATVSCASTLQFLPRLAFPMERTASVRPTINEAHTERGVENRDIGELSESVPCSIP